MQKILSESNEMVTRSSEKFSHVDTELSPLDFGGCHILKNCNKESQHTLVSIYHMCGDVEGINMTLPLTSM